MSAVAILTPLVHAHWPQLAKAIVAAAASAGFNVEEAEREMEKGKSKSKFHSCDLDLENVDVVAGSMARDDKIVVEREGARVIFSRDGRGAFKVCVEGELPKEELEKIGQDLAGKVIQQHVYRRVSEELAQQGFVTLEEEKGPDQSIHLHVRRYEE